MRLIAITLFALACSGGGGSTNTTGGGTTGSTTGGTTGGGGCVDMAGPLSACGHPCDKGNSLGVGKFCTHVSDCMGPGLSTNICSSLGNGATPSASDTYFCTIFPCTPDAGVNDGCGEGAHCVADPRGSACAPDNC
jgi:hypothetical protein